MWGRKMVVAGEKGLSVMQDEGEVSVFEGAKIKQEVVIFMDTKLLPLVGIDLMKEGSPGMMGDVCQNRKQRMGLVGIHCYSSELRIGKVNTPFWASSYIPKNVGSWGLCARKRGRDRGNVVYSSNCDEGAKAWYPVGAGRVQGERRRDPEGLPCLWVR